ncbi:hypothetical protein O181_083884 [Austropuccinia psidii MF-1]|uniref:Uncharacterized protein n=1 Tax=Austropuccinia psidii MF-1 TaxID=1389203 RepID=A0A9Q3FS29_9BASI|nr:hypothetical protein [Austropuccinia psidii MF-1]
MAPRPPFECTCCKKDGNRENRFTHLAEDLDRRIFRAQELSYIFLKYWGVPIEGNESSKDIVRYFEKGQDQLHNKFIEKTVIERKLEEEIKPTEKKAEDKST